MGSPQTARALPVLLLAMLFVSAAQGTKTHLHFELHLLTHVTALFKACFLAGQAFDSILTLDMQIFGQSFASFGPGSQSIITQGVANFLNSGVTASQIVLTVKDLIAGVSHSPACNTIRAMFRCSTGQHSSADQGCSRRQLHEPEHCACMHTSLGSNTQNIPAHNKNAASASASLSHQGPWPRSLQYCTAAGAVQTLWFHLQQKSNNQACIL